MLVNESQAAERTVAASVGKHKTVTFGDVSLGLLRPTCHLMESS